MIERCSFGNEDYYNLLASLDFLPNSPTLFNAGTEQGTLSGCFKFNVEDTMESIMAVATKAAFTLKYGGGTGYCLSEVRPYGRLIRSTHGKACGPVSVVETYHAVARMITQGGKREGAQMAMLSCDHEDIRRFIHCKDEESVDLPDFGLEPKQAKAVKQWILTKYGLSTFNLSVACTDKFMKEAKEGVNKLFEEMCESAWKTGDPGIYFIDVSERTNPTPWLGKLDGTNACGEVPALNNEPCNLGSINLSHMIFNVPMSLDKLVDASLLPESVKQGWKIDFNKLRDTARLATRYLDEVIDRNFYPDSAIEKASKLTRKIGLGVMGWADTLALLHIHYDSVEAVNLGREVMKAIQEASHEESRKLAVEKGSCPAFLFEIPGVEVVKARTLQRNATTTCVAPAGTISVLASCSSGIEPHYTLEGSRSMGDGTRLEDGLRGLKADFVPRTAHEVDWKWHVRHQAAFQQYADLAVSKTINMRESATVDDVRQAFLYAWESGCKGMTVYRDKSRDKQIIVSRGEESRLFSGHAQTPVDTYSTDTKYGLNRRKLPKDIKASRHKFAVGDVEGYLHPGFFPNGDLGEVFISTKQGSTIAGLLDGIAILTSIALQYNVPLEVMVNKLRNSRFEPAGITDDTEIPVATSLLDYIFRYLQLHHGNGRLEQTSEHSGMVCPDCGISVIYEEGCLKCTKCGWSRCG
jgi:ribonucleoside-diphosphate reductase alpha chain